MKTLRLFFILILCSSLYGGTDPKLTGKNFVASGDIFGTRVFVENKGQFDLKAPAGVKILYALNHGQERIYFTSSGLIYEMVKSFPLSERKMEEVERGKEVHYKPDEVHLVHMNWAGALSGSMTVEADEKQSHYITYGDPELNSNTFKKLTYRNVYKNIDIEYIIPDDKTHGIKYNILLHRGADASQVRIVYSGDVRKIRKRKSGDIFIGTRLWDLLEHFPQSYYDNGEPLKSEFELRGDTIALRFPEGYQSAREVVVDPWVAAVTTLTNNNLAYDVDFDFGGDMFIFGSFGYAKVARYSNAGTLLWTFSGQIISTGWGSQQSGVNGSVGNFAVDKITSKTYVGQGANFPTVIRLTSAGAYDNYVTPINNLFQELWEMNFSCLTGDILIVGGGHTSNLSAATINTVAPVLTLSSFNPSNTAFVHDISAFCQDDFGNSFAYYACSNASLNQKITRVNSTYNGSLWTMPSGFSVFAEINNKSNYGGGGIPSAGFNGLFANNNYLYYYDGNNLAAYNKATGTLVASSVIGYGAKQVGGIAVDNCDNIYIGGYSVIACYHFNGTTFSALPSISLQQSATSRVFDIRHNRSTGQLYVTGNGFCGTYPAVHSMTCSGGAGICLFSQMTIAANTNSITCATLGSATIIPNNGIGPFTYTWVPSMQTGPSANNLAPGTHTVIVYDAGFNMTYTTTTFFAPAVPLTATLNTTTYLNCNSMNNGTAAIASLQGGSANQTYTWTNGLLSTYTPSLSGLGIGNYTLTIKDVLTSCILTKTFSIAQPQPLSSFIIASTPSTCVGGTVNLNGITAGGVPAYNYSWINGPATSNHSVTETLSGMHSYTLTSTDYNGCITNALININFVPLPVISVASTSICPLKTGTLSANGASTYTWTGGGNSSIFTDAPTSNSSYTVSGSLAGCSSAATGSIFILPLPVPSITGSLAACNGQNVLLNGNGGVAYLWQGPQFFNSISPSALLANTTINQSGLYSVTVTAANSCTAATSASVTIHPSPTLSVLGGTICSTQNLSLNANSSSAIYFMWTGVNGFNSTSQNPLLMTPSASASGFYSVTAMSALGCTRAAVAHASITNIPQISPFNSGPACENQAILLNGSGGQGGVSFVWTGPNAFFNGAANVNLTNVMPSQSGNYTLTVTEGPCQISGTTQVLVRALPQPVLSYNQPVCERATLQLSLTCAASSTLIAQNWNGPNFNSPYQYPIRPNSTTNFSGNYSVQVTDIFLCSNTAMLAVSILKSPDITVTGDTVCLYQPAQLLANGASTYTWASLYGLAGHGTTLNISNANSPLPVIYTVTGTALNTCTNVAKGSLHTYSLPIVSAVAQPSTAVCANSEFTFSAFGAQSYTWQGPANFSSLGQEIKWRAPHAGFSGQYEVKGVDANGCEGRAGFNLLIHPLPDAGLIGGPFSSCVPFCGTYSVVQYRGAPLIDTKWVLNQQISYPGNFKSCFEKAGNYLLLGTYTDSNNCSGSNTLSIHAAEKPKAQMNVSPEHPVENGDPVQFQDLSEGGTMNSWQWNLLDVAQQKTSLYKVQHPAHYFENSGSYVLALVVKNTEGCSDTTVKSIRVEDDFLVFVPNAFTPNSDGRNECFLPVLRGQKFFGLQIYDRWGHEIFSITELSKGWDGTHKGNACPEGVYNWKLSIAAKSGVQKILSGAVTLYR